MGARPLSEHLREAHPREKLRAIPTNELLAQTVRLMLGSRLLAAGVRVGAGVDCNTDGWRVTARFRDEYWAVVIPCTDIEVATVSAAGADVVLAALRKLCGAVASTVQWSERIAEGCTPYRRPHASAEDLT